MQHSKKQYLLLFACFKINRGNGRLFKRGAYSKIGRKDNEKKY